jgi:hypothetical protein
LLNRTGSVDLVADLVGWYTPDSGGSLFHVLAPQRVLDTRTQAGQRLAAGAVRDVQVAGVGAVPASGVTAVAAELVGLDPSAPTDVAAYATPNDDSSPVGTSLYVDAHGAASALAVAATGVGDEIRVRNGPADVVLLMDLVGWFGP